MKKVVFIIFLALSGLSVTAQGLDLGIKVGVNFSSISDAAGLDNRTGFIIGGFVGFKLADKLGVQADLLYSQQGAKVNPDDIDLNYVNVPIVLKYYFIKNVNIQIGPQFGFIVDDNISDVFGNILEAESFDLSGVVGAGIDFPMGIRVDGRYNFGLTDIFNAAGTKSGKNAVATISVGYSFF